MTIKGIIFDMDGVVTQTAVIHYKAWKIVFDRLLSQINPSFNPFTEEDYFYFLDGMSRVDGVTNFLTSRELSLKELQKLYTSVEECIAHLCETKNELLLAIISENSVDCFADTLEFIKLLLLHNYSIAIISSSKNCLEILKSAKVEKIFPVRVDGIVSETIGIPGKPNPAIFLEAAKQLNLLPQECMVIEDALSGVKAAKEGAFGVVVALDRKNKLHAQFSELEADYILPDLSKKQTTFYQKIFCGSEKKLESAFNILPLIANLLENKNELIVFLDYDGTLTPIVERPENALLSPTMLQCLTQLSQKYTTVIISGRELNNLKNLINIPNIYYSGNHGFEFTGPECSNMFYQIGHEFVDELTAVYQALYGVFQKIKGCIIENKKFSLSIHYRLVDENLHEYISQKIEDNLSSFPNLTRHYGKKVFEIRPNIHWNKGLAAENILTQFKLVKNNLIPVYIGDDVTDEDAFTQFGLNGITIKVTPESYKTNAHYFLKSPKEVLEFLIHLNNFKEVSYESLAH